MSMWKIELEGFPSQWLDIADKFENGTERMLIRCANEKKAETLRFEWYAFKRRLKVADQDKPMEQRMYPTLPRIKAEVGKLKSGEWALRLVLRDVGENASALDEALAATPEEIEALDADFGPA